MKCDGLTVIPCRTNSSASFVPPTHSATHYKQASIFPCEFCEEGFEVRSCRIFLHDIVEEGCGGDGFEHAGCGRGDGVACTCISIGLPSYINALYSLRKSNADWPGVDQLFTATPEPFVA